MKKYLFTLFFTLSISCLFASNYYWIGGTGNYSDISHWATTSGGGTLQTVPPTVSDDVYFDANSFPGANDTVYFDSAYSVAHSFSVSGFVNAPTFFDSPLATDFEVYGNFFLAPGINWQSTAIITFNSGDPYNTVQTNGTLLPDVNFVSFGPYTLLDDLHCGNLNLWGGGFDTGGHDVFCTLAIIDDPGPLYFRTSVITTTSYISFYTGGSNAPIVYSDSATFIAPASFDIGPSADNVHIGSVQSPGITSTNCYYKRILPSPAYTGIIGTGNHIELASANIGIGTNMWGSPPNFITKVLAPDTFIANGNLVVDSIIFLNPGADFEIFDTLTLNGGLIMNNTPARQGFFHEFGDSGYFNVNSGIICFDFTQLRNIDAIGGAQFFAGFNSLNIGFTCNGWQFTGCTTAGGVWPGDANYDLRVDNLDILAIGIASGETGPVRGGATNNWIEQPVTDWSNSFVTGVNMKHADCDGNGVVDITDTVAVSLNYGLQHPASRLANQNVNPNSSSFLSIDVTPDSVGPNTPVHVSINLSIDSIYGIAFSVNYNPALLDASSLIPDFSNTWLGTNGVNMIGFAKANPVEGRIDFALTRTDHTDAFGGAGQLLSFDMVTAPIIPVASTLNMEVNNVNGIFLSETYEVIAGNTDSSFVDSTVSVQKYEAEFMNLNAWISNQILSVAFYAGYISPLELTLSDVTGRIIYSNSIFTEIGFNKKEIALNNLAGGIYILTVTGEFNKSSVKATWK